MYDKLILIGNISNDAELQYTAEGKAICRMNIAVDRGKDKKPIWYRVTCWDKTAEVMGQYAKKGRALLIEGRLEYDPETGGPRLWTDKNGVQRASYEVSASVVQFVGGAGSNGNERQAASPVTGRVRPTSSARKADDW